jgi:tetratricopeptide (TPR) repeat protein
MATLAAGLICACGVAMYVGLGWSLARPETGAMSGLPAAIQEQGRALYTNLRWLPLSTAAQIRLGMFYLANNRPAPASAWLQRALVWDPASWQAWYYLGRTQRVAHHYYAAETAFRRTLALNPDYVAARVQIAGILLDAGLFADAADAYNALLHTRADQVRITEAIGTALLREGKYPEARDAFLQVLAKTPSFAEAHAGLAVALRATGDTQGAARETRVARGLAGTVPLRNDDPLTETMEREFPTAQTLYQLSVRDRDPSNGAETLQRALALDPRLPGGWEALIKLEGQAKRPKEAEDAWLHLAAIDPRSELGRYNLGGALAQAGQLKRAAGVLSEALALDPSDAEAYRMLGVVQDLDGNREEAARQYRKAFALDPTMAEAHVDLGLLMLKMGQVKEALAELLQALLPPCEQPERTLVRELAGIRNQEFQSAFEQAVRAQAEERHQPQLITVLNNRKKPAAQSPTGFQGLAAIKTLPAPGTP